jgi:hypothetical protein
MAKAKTTPSLDNIERTSVGLRDALFDELDLLRSGEGNAQRAQAVAKLSAQIVSSVKMELDYARFANTAGRPAKSAVKTAPESLMLGTAA